MSNEGTNEGIQGPRVAHAGSNLSHPVVLSLNENDVLMGRGSPSAEYSGNIRFRQVVWERREEYLRATRRNDKHKIAKEIIDEVHRRGGRFLQRITTMEEAERLQVPPRTQAWRMIPCSKALFIKVKQLMRDVGPETQQQRMEKRQEKRRLIRAEKKGQSDHDKLKPPPVVNVPESGMGAMEQNSPVLGSGTHRETRQLVAPGAAGPSDSEDRDRKPPAIVNAQSRSTRQSSQMGQVQSHFQPHSGIPAQVQFSASPLGAGVSQSAQEQLLRQLLAAAAQLQQRQQSQSDLSRLSQTVLNGPQRSLPQWQPLALPIHHPVPQQSAATTQVSLQQMVDLLNLLQGLQQLSSADRDLLSFLLNSHCRR